MGRLPSGKPKKIYPQTNVRFNEDDKARMQRIALELHKRGVPGVVDRQYQPRTTELLRYLLEEYETQLLVNHANQKDTAMKDNQRENVYIDLFKAKLDNLARHEKDPAKLESYQELFTLLNQGVDLQEKYLDDAINGISEGDE